MEPLSRHLLAWMGLAVAATSAAGQAVQLPSFSMFSVDTTVVVPDRGGTYLGGDRSASSSVNTFGGIPRNRGWGITRQSAAAQVTATIHDPQEAEAALIGSLVRRRDAKQGTARSLRIAAGEAASDAPLASVAELKRRRAEQAAAGQQEALALFEKGRLAEREGKAAVAALYLRNAARRATGPLLERINAELKALESAATTARSPAAPGAAKK